MAFMISATVRIQHLEVFAKFLCESGLQRYKAPVIVFIRITSLVQFCKTWLSILLRLHLVKFGIGYFTNVISVCIVCLLVHNVLPLNSLRHKF